jgi:flagellar FliL protein
MSDHSAPATAPAAQTSDAAAAPKKSSALTKIVVLAFMVAVIGGECLVASFYLTSMSAAPAQTAEHSEHGEHGDEAGDEEAAPAAKREVDLGKFSITSFQPASNTTLLIDFHMFGTVAAEASASTEAAAPAEGHGGHGGGHGEPAAAADDEFSRLFEKHKHRLRDQVIVIVRSAEITDFADPSLGLIRRKILEKSNRLLGKPLLEEVIFSDFSLVEQ